MLIECCAQERTYLRFYGSLGERFCCMSPNYQLLFDEAFAKQYAMIHRLETNKLRNMAKFFAHLIHSEALPWGVFEYLVITEEETTSSSRIFIKAQPGPRFVHWLSAREKPSFTLFCNFVLAGALPGDC